MSNTVKQLGFIPTNRGEFDTTGQTKYYKDNVVQYRNGSYICSPVGYSSSNPTAYTTDAPYQDGDTQLNANWKLMASVGLVDAEPTAGSNNLVKSGGVYEKVSQLDQNVFKTKSPINILVENDLSFIRAGFRTDLHKRVSSIYTRSFVSPIYANDIVKLTVDTGFKIILVVYSGEFEYESHTQLSNEYINDGSYSGKYLNFFIKKNDDSELLPTENTGLVLYSNVRATLKSFYIKGKTLHDVFITNQLIPDMLFDFATTDDTPQGIFYHLNAGSINRSFDIDIKAKVCSFALDFSCQYRNYNDIATTIGNKYFCAGKFKLSRVEQSSTHTYDFLKQQACGFGFRNDVQRAISGGDNQWHIVNSIVTANESSSRFYLGSMGSANMDGFFTNFVICDLSIFNGDLPTRKELIEAYAKFCTIVSLRTETEKIAELSKPVPFETCEYDEKMAFIDAMNEKAKSLGMTSSTFDNPGGTPSANHKTTVSDYLKLTAMCVTDNLLMNCWGFPTKNILIKGTNSRVISITSTYKGISDSSALEADYHIYGGKTGTWSQSPDATKNLLLVVRSKVDNAILCGVIAGSTNTNRFVPMKELLDWLEDYRVNSATPTPTLQCDYAAACVLPIGNPNMYTPDNIVQVGKDANTLITPASITKLMTCVTLADYSFAAADVLRVNGGDIMSGSGWETQSHRIQDGDLISYTDAIAFYMMISQNSLSSTFARYCGRKILEQLNS